MLDGGQTQAQAGEGVRPAREGRSGRYAVASAAPVRRPMVRALELEQWRTKLRLYMKRCVASPTANRPGMTLPFSPSACHDASVFTPPIVAT